MLRSFSGAASEVMGTDPGEWAAQAARVMAIARRRNRSPERRVDGKLEAAAERPGRLDPVRVVEAPVERHPGADEQPPGEEMHELETEPAVDLVGVDGARIQLLSKPQVGRDFR